MSEPMTDEALEWLRLTYQHAEVSGDVPAKRLLAEVDRLRVALAEAEQALYFHRERSKQAKEDAAARDRVKALHRESDVLYAGTTICAFDGRAYPCPTLVAMKYNDE